MDGNKRRVPRYIDKVLKENVIKFPVVILEGPLAVGKTDAALFLKPNIITIEDINEKGLDILLNPTLNNGSNIYFIDEFQQKFEIYDFLNQNKDLILKKGYHYLLTSSYLPKIKKPYKDIDESFFKRIQMIGLSNYEAGHSNGTISLNEILHSNYVISDNLGNLNGTDIFIDLIFRGSFPYTNLNKELSEEEIHKFLLNYYISIEPRLKKADNPLINISSISRVMRALARNECSLCSNAYLIDDIYNNENYQIEPNTVNSYIYLLNKLYLFDNIGPLPDDEYSFLNKYTKIKQVQKKRYFDTSINVYTLELLKDEINTPILKDIFDSLLKSLTIKDLKLYLLNNEEFNLYNYQDYLFNGLDIVFKSNITNEYIGADIILNKEDIEESVKKVLKVKKDIAEKRGYRFKRFFILVANLNKSYLYNEDIYVCPILALKD